MPHVLHLPPTDVVRFWSVSDVVSWLQNNCPAAVQAFRHRNIDGQKFLALEECHLLTWTDLPIRYRRLIADSVKCLTNLSNGHSDMRFPLSLPAGRSRNKPPVPPKSDYAEEPDCDSDGWGSDFAEDDHHAQGAGFIDDIDDGDYIDPDDKTDGTLRLPSVERSQKPQHLPAEAIPPPVPRNKKPGVNKLHMPSPPDTFQSPAVSGHSLANKSSPPVPKPKKIPPVEPLSPGRSAKPPAPPPKPTIRPPALNMPADDTYVEPDELDPHVGQTDYYMAAHASKETYTLPTPPVRQREDNPPPLPPGPRPVVGDRVSGCSTVSTSSTSSNEGGPPVALRKRPKQILPHPWYHGNVDRYEAEIKVKNVGVEGAFLVRESTSGGTECQHKLTIYCLNSVRHLLIRLRNDGFYALGSYKDDELTFDSIAHLVEYHKQHVITFTAGSQALLTRHVTKDV